jgi:hypothetical protein
VSTTLSST